MTLTTIRTKRTADSLQLDDPTIHKRSKSTSTRVKTQIQSLLFRLPHEIRQYVFLLALSKPPPTTLLDSSHHDASDVEPALLYSCQRVRDEALPLFYSNNDWMIKIRRVGGEAGRLDPVTKRLVTYQCIPRWIDSLPDDKITWIRNIVLVGSRGSYVDINGRWRDGDRTAFRLKRLNGRLAYSVDEVDVHDDDVRQQPQQKEEADAFCSIQLLDLLKARMRINLRDSHGRWHWTRQHIHDLAFLL